METHELINLIVRKFGGNRVKFTMIKDEIVWFIVGHNEYRCYWSVTNKHIFVSNLRNGEVGLSDDYSRWVEGRLNNLVRNDKGQMVPR